MPTSSHLHGLRGWVRGIGLLFVSVVAVEYVAVHLLAGAVRSWPSLGSAAPVLLLAALVTELLSLVCFSKLTSVLMREDAPDFRTVLAIDVTGNGFSHVVPVGGATAAALRLRLYGRAGVATPEAAAAAAGQYAVTLLWLVAVLVLGLVVAVPSPRTQPLVRTAAALAAVLLTAIAGLVAVLVARPDQVVRVTHAIAGRLPLVRPQVLEGVVRSLADQVHLLLHSPRASRRATLWGLGYWAFDAASLHLSVWAFGGAPTPGGLLTTYALVSLLALLPVTPGGLGLVEGAAVPLLVSFGSHHDVALLGVLTWRLFGFWLTIPLGLAAYTWLRTRTRSSAHHSHGVPITSGAVAPTAPGPGPPTRPTRRSGAGRAVPARPGARVAAPRAPGGDRAAWCCAAPRTWSTPTGGAAVAFRASRAVRCSHASSRAGAAPGSGSRRTGT
ncbi:hypothetical protein ASC64_06970 [Nocardioides sp. Root122]|uniref:lysylphosphatidylglycerol synthase transmembrane domain-containing protein n=1 Tax=Nocardioides TaxID=1839 RepID=UPI00070397BD|nr:MULTISPECIES: lysylphosphatidylglycerol synthase transmembrane domain-containing protein [Nocardioides]KQV69581.1 hypothetical protein ASC64_06970 [Nocardioides sp. Root122]MCK9824492.1 flippase-like domain-containing protein [Nocardioides cavernae]